jgi:N-acetylmuramoyl-L-alanine amidase
LIARATWGAKHGRGTPIPGGLGLVVIHHTAGPDIPEDATEQRERDAVRGIERHHVEGNKWAGIGYNWLIFPSGRVYEGRGWRRRGAHCASKNSVSVGVAFVANTDVTEPTEKAIRACKDLLAFGVLGGHLKVGHEVKGHRDFDSTKCPGDKLYTRLKDLG